MDSQTHVELAAKLLSISGCSPVFSVVSLFPQIDRHPPTLHRMYAHTVFKAIPITNIGLRVLEQDDWQDAAHAFEVRRFKEEKSRLLSYVKDHVWTPPDKRSDSREAVLLAYVSHLYLDTYNQPTQPFAPLSVYCAGQWSLWEKIGDFRLKLYTTPVIGQLRHDLFTQAFWSDVPALSPVALIQAMLMRMCKLSQGKISETLVVSAMRALELDIVSIIDIVPARDFLEHFEATLTRLHIQYLLPQAESEQESIAASVYCDQREKLAV